MQLGGIAQAYYGCSLNRSTPSPTCAEAGESRRRLSFLGTGRPALQHRRVSNPPIQTDDDCVRHVLQQLEGTNTTLLYRNYTPDLRNKYIDMGITMLLESPQA